MAAPHLLIAARSADLEDKRHSLLKAWRQRRTTRTAELFLAASRRLAREAPPARSLESAQAQWLEAADKQDGRDLDWLLETVVTPTWELSLERVAKLDAWLDDPRIAIGLVELVGRRPFTSTEAEPFWRCVFGMIERRADHSTLSAIGRVLETLPKDAGVDKELCAIDEKIRQTPPVEEYLRDGPTLDAIAASLAEP